MSKLGLWLDIIILEISSLVKQSNFYSLPGFFRVQEKNQDTPSLLL